MKLKKIKKYDWPKSTKAEERIVVIETKTKELERVILINTIGIVLCAIGIVFYAVIGLI